MTLNELYELAKEIPEYLKYENKYAWLGYNNIIDVRYLDVDDILRVKTPINNFINEHGSVLLLPNIVNGHVVDLLVRALDSPQMINYREVNLPYNIGNLKDFKYGDPLFIVEGPADVAGLKLVDPNIAVVALKTNDINKDAYQVYKSLTNKIVLVLDSDKAGQLQLVKMRLNLKELGISTYTINQFGYLKDTGEIAEITMSYEKSKNTELLIELNNINLYYKAQIKLIKMS